MTLALPEAKTEKVLLEVSREEYGGGDGRAINRHSTRTYQLEDGSLIDLDRNLSCCPPYFELVGPYREPAKDEMIMPPIIRIDGKEHWGGGWSWKRAEARMLKELGYGSISRGG